MDPKNGAYLDSYGWVLFKMGRLKEAEGKIRKALEIIGDDATIYDHLGQIYYREGMYEEAKIQWEKALQIDPTNEKIKKRLKWQGE